MLHGLTDQLTVTYKFANSFATKKIRQRLTIPLNTQTHTHPHNHIQIEEGFYLLTISNSGLLDKTPPEN